MRAGRTFRAVACEPRSPASADYGLILDDAAPRTARSRKQVSVSNSARAMAENASLNCQRCHAVSGSDTGYAAMSGSTVAIVSPCWIA